MDHNSISFFQKYFVVPFERSADKNLLSTYVLSNINRDAYVLGQGFWYISKIYGALGAVAQKQHIFLQNHYVLLILVGNTYKKCI